MLCGCDYSVGGVLGGCGASVVGRLIETFQNIFVIYTHNCSMAGHFSLVLHNCCPMVVRLSVVVQNVVVVVVVIVVVVVRLSLAVQN